MSNIKKVLAVDKKYRKVGVEGDLYTINELVSDLTLDYDMPTLCNNNHDEPNIFINSIKEFKKEFYICYPSLNNLDMTNLFIAGGSISNIVRKKYNSDSDIDFFVYGLSPRKATARIKQWLTDILVPKGKNKKDHDSDRSDDNRSDDDRSDDGYSSEEDEPRGKYDKKEKYDIPITK